MASLARTPQVSHHQPSWISHTIEWLDMMHLSCLDLAAILAPLVLLQLPCPNHSPVSTVPTLLAGASPLVVPSLHRVTLAHRADANARIDQPSAA